MRRGRGRYFWMGMATGVLAALVVAGVPVVAATVDGPGTQAALNPGDPLQAGRVNEIDKTTWIRGAAPNANLRLVNEAPGPALRLTTQSGSAPLAVDSKVRVPLLNADRVDNRHASELIRVAHAATCCAPDENGPILSVSITAPRPGFLVISGGVDAFGSTFDSFRCLLTVDGASVLGSFRGINVHDAGTEHTKNSSENCDTSGTQPVNAGTHEVALDIGSLQTAGLADASLQAIYIPYGPTG